MPSSRPHSHEGSADPSRITEAGITDRAQSLLQTEVPWLPNRRDLPRRSCVAGQRTGRAGAAERAAGRRAGLRRPEPQPPRGARAHRDPGADLQGSGSGLQLRGRHGEVQDEPGASRSQADVSGPVPLGRESTDRTGGRPSCGRSSVAPLRDRGSGYRLLWISRTERASRYTPVSSRTVSLGHAGRRFCSSTRKG
jgi:hypothetical protein